MTYIMYFVSIIQVHAQYERSLKLLDSTEDVVRVLSQNLLLSIPFPSISLNMDTDIDVRAPVYLTVSSTSCLFLTRQAA